MSFYPNPTEAYVPQNAKKNNPVGNHFENHVLRFFFGGGPRLKTHFTLFCIKHVISVIWIWNLYEMCKNISSFLKCYQNLILFLELELWCSGGWFQRVLKTKTKNAISHKSTLCFVGQVQNSHILKKTERFL